MKENKLFAICILILSISIFAGSLWIGTSIKNANLSYSSYSLTNNKALMTEAETAEYLSLAHDQFKSLVTSLELQRAKLSSYDTYRFIPFIQIDEVKYFNKEQVDKWVEYNVINRIDINTNLNAGAGREKQ